MDDRCSILKTHATCIGAFSNLPHNTSELNNMAETIKNVLGQATGGAIGNQLPTHKLGKNGPHVTALGYGTMGLSAFYGKPKPDNERFAVLDRVFERGELFWDTADMYQDSEDLLGNWFKQNPGKREKIFLASKFANCVAEDGSRYVDSSPEYARKACLKSLSRLGVDHIDLCKLFCRKIVAAPNVSRLRSSPRWQDTSREDHGGAQEAATGGQDQVHWSF